GRLSLLRDYQRGAEHSDYGAGCAVDDGSADAGCAAGAHEPRIEERALRESGSAADGAESERCSGAGGRGYDGVRRVERAIFFGRDGARGAGNDAGQRYDALLREDLGPL